MTAVEKSKLIQVPVEPCYTGLLQVLKNLGVQIVASDDCFLIGAEFIV